ncbi:methyltransferase domain-containing protein [Myxococcota bacterium]|nr:methyltransferase domain-containing protein [Myxococcota bacterium]
MHPTHTKQIHNFKYYTGAHPEIQAHYRKGNRPTEFGNKVWATSLVLLDYLQKNPFKLRSLRVLEIGCGWGLLGVYLAKEYSCSVTCSDLDKHVLPIVQMHAELNGVSVETRPAAFNDLTIDYLKNFDLIIGAEVCYSEEVAQDIIQLIERASKAKLKHILIADPGRPDFDDCHAYCVEHCKTELIELPGSINGKTTQLLSALLPRGTTI